MCIYMYMYARIIGSLFVNYDNTLCSKCRKSFNYYTAKFVQIAPFPSQYSPTTLYILTTDPSLPLLMISGCFVAYSI